MGEAAGDRSERGLAARRIAAQREDVLNAQHFRLVEYGGQHLLRRANARQVRHGLDAELAANAVDHRRVVSRVPPPAP